MTEQVRAEVRQVPSSSEGGAFQTFSLLIPAGRHWQMNNGRVADVFIYSPTDDELRSIVEAARSEIRRRHNFAHPRPCADCDVIDIAKEATQ